MQRPVLKEWGPPRPKEIYTETFRPNPKTYIRNYEQCKGDLFTLIAEFTVVSLSRQAAWKEAVRAARAIVKNYLIRNVIVEFFPITDGHLFERIRIFEKHNLSDWQTPNSTYKKG